MNKLRFLSSCLVICLSLEASYTFAEVSLPMLKSQSKGLDWEAIERGEVVAHSLPKREVNDAALSVIVGVKVRASIDDVLSYMKDATPSLLNIRIDVSSDEAITESVSNYEIAAEADVDIAWLKNPKADGTINATKADLEILKAAALTVSNSTSGGDDISPITNAVRLVLENRLREYLAGGLNGMSPYYVDGENIEAGQYLADSLEPFSLLKKEESEFYDAFLNYPANHQVKPYLQEFYLVTELEGSKPITSLKHWMINTQPEYTLIAERNFYISHSLDAMHTLILLMASGDSTYLFMVNTSFTQIVTGIGSFIAHKVGRSKVKGNIVPIFESVAKNFQ